MAGPHLLDEVTGHTMPALVLESRSSNGAQTKSTPYPRRRDPRLTEEIGRGTLYLTKGSWVDTKLPCEKLPCETRPKSETRQPCCPSPRDEFTAINGTLSSWVLRVFLLSHSQSPTPCHCHFSQPQKFNHNLKFERSSS